MRAACLESVLCLPKKNERMTEGLFFADVSLPFHVWVRETAGGRPRWVLREAKELDDPQGSRAAAERRPGVRGGSSS